MKNTKDPKNLLGLEELSPMETGEIQGGANKEQKQEQKVDVEVEADIDL